ncbi:caspase family protein [Actinopolymorpha pittospori]|nr:caspase family protein [Actinopolymorpha pittospori]
MGRKLAACELDANDMLTIADARGFDSDIVLTTQATAETVKDAIHDAAQRLGNGDLFFCTYSGHGGQVPDRNGKEEPDGMDETWVLYDRQLVDDELYAIWGEFEAGVRILVLSDSCHSGTMTRDAAEIFEAVVPMIVERGLIDDDNPRTKCLPRNVQDVTYTQHRELYDDIQATHRTSGDVDLQAAVLLVSGCQDDQLSLDGQRNGLFTQTLRQVWHDGQFSGPYSRFHKEIVALMPPTQTPNLLPLGGGIQRFVREQPIAISP